MKNRRDNGKATRFKPGNSGGPGRPKGSKSLANMVAEQTRDGAELVEIMLGIARNVDAKDADRIRACEYLTDRGFGKVPQPISGDGSDTGGAIIVRWGGRGDGDSTPA